MSCPDAGLIKALFHQLVGRCGGVEACAAVLGVTSQRVSQLQSMNCGDLPSLSLIVKLERFVGEAIVTGGLANAVRRDAQPGDLGRETRQATYAAVALQQGVDEGLSRDELRARAQALHRELEDVNQALAMAPT
jgi:hypothetical protein